MCFTPTVSFLTFAIEIIMAAWVLMKDPKNRVNQLSAAILLFLGLYQLTEFMICSAGNELFWGRMGFIFYTTLPALGFDWVYAIKRSKKTVWPVYIIPAAFIIYAIVVPNFTLVAECGRYFVRAIHNWIPLLSWEYMTYYTLFIVWPALILFKAVIDENNKSRRRLYIWGLIGLLAFTVPTLFVMLILPAWNILFPSVLCHFALLYAAAVTYIIYLNEKIK